MDIGKQVNKGFGKSAAELENGRIMADQPEGGMSISLELLRKIWKDYVTPLVLIKRGANIRPRDVVMGRVVYTDDMEGVSFKSWKDELPFPDFVDQWLEGKAEKVQP